MAEPLGRRMDAGRPQSERGPVLRRRPCARLSRESDRSATGATWRANGSACGGTTDYWINGLGGAPFFLLTQPVNPGLIAVLRQHIVPRLLAEAPQPGIEALEADALLPRFTLIFDREGYSPDFFAELKAQRIAILSYHKFPGEKWPV